MRTWYEGDPAVRFLVCLWAACWVMSVVATVVAWWVLR